jgi:Flp pilus assembly protein TadB
VSAGLIGGVAVAAAIFALGSLPLARRWRLPLAHPERTALRDAGWAMPVARWEAFRAGLIVAGVLLFALSGPSPVVGLLGGAVPSVLVRARAAAARDRARHALAPMLLSTHAALRSGLALPEALRRAVAGCSDAIARRPFEDALTRFDLGDPLDASLAAGAMRAGDPRTADAMRTLALGVSERMPVDRSASLLNAVAELARHDEVLHDEIRARSAGTRVQMYLLAAVVPSLAAYLVVTMPGLAATLGSGLGRAVLVPAAAGLEVAGIVVSRRIIRSVSE